MEKRRSFYSIGKTKTLPNDKVVEIVKYCVKHAPSSFNFQTARCMVLFDAQHDELW